MNTAAMKDFKVKKRDGTVEPWSDDKLVTSMTRAGIPIEEAEKFAQSIREWGPKNLMDHQVTSIQLRDKVIEMIKTDYPAEADSFQAYKKG